MSMLDGPPEGRPTRTEIIEIDPTWTQEQLTEVSKNINEAMLLLDEDIGSIKSQIEEAKTRRWSHGQYSDPSWWRRANDALHHKGRQRQAYQTALGQVNRRLRALRNDQANQDIRQLFMDAAKRLLPPETLQLLWDEVRREQIRGNYR